MVDRKSFSMLYPISFMAMAVFCPLLKGTPEAGTVKTESFNSVILQKSITYDVYLPNSYTGGSNSTRYPVIYLLHWYSGNKNDWTQTGIQQTVDSIQAIAVAPSDGVTTSWWMDAPKIPGQKMCTFLVKDLKPHIDSLYRTDPSRGKTGRSEERRVGKEC
jgi:S-formylglutathione hydrolase FrmB